MVLFFFQISYTLVFKIEICLRYFFSKIPKNQPLCYATKYGAAQKLISNTSASSEMSVTTHCELLLMSLYVSDYGTQWRIGLDPHWKHPWHLFLLSLKKKKIESFFKKDFNQLWTAAASFLNVRKRLWNTMAHCQSNFNNASHHGWLILNQSRHRVRVCCTVLHCDVFCRFFVRSWLSS